MASFEASVHIHASPEAIFSLTHDYARRLDWDTLLREARLLNGAREAGLGVESLCVGRGRLLGLAVRSAYVAFRPPELAAVKMTRGPWLFRRFAASIRHEREGSGTRVVYRGQVVTRPTFLRFLVEPLVARVFARETRRRLEALRDALEGKHAEHEDGKNPRGAEVDSGEGTPECGISSPSSCSSRPPR
jgi:hypothetical protein